MDLFMNSENFKNYDADHPQPIYDNSFGSKSTETKQELSEKYKVISGTKSLVLEDEVKKSIKSTKLKVGGNQENKLQCNQNKKTISIPMSRTTNQQDKGEIKSDSTGLPPCLSQSYQFFYSASQPNQTFKEQPVLNLGSEKNITEQEILKVETTSLKETLHETRNIEDCRNELLPRNNCKSQLPEMLALRVNLPNKIMSVESDYKCQDIFLEQKSMGNKYDNKLHLIKHQICDTSHKVLSSDERPDMQLPLLQKEKFMPPYKTSVFKRNQPENITFLKFTNVDSLSMKDYPVNSSPMKPNHTNSENKYVTQFDSQLMHSSIENKNLEKTTGIEKDFTLIYTKRLIQKCWRTWRAYVRSACFQKACSEERIICKAKIYKFIDNLRHHKESSDFKNLTMDVEKKEECINLQLFERNQSHKIISQPNLITTARDEKNNKVEKETTINLKRSNTSHTSLDKCHASSSVMNNKNLTSGVKNKLKYPQLKYTAPISHRFEIQKQIISKQRKQLEHQKKVINGLKLENLSKEAKLSATRALCHLPRALHLKNEISNSDDSKQSQVRLQQWEMPKKEKWLLLMREREKNMEKERRLKKEMELLTQKKAEEEERKRIDNEMKEKRRLRLQSEKKRQLVKERLEESVNRAKQHYKKKLLEKYGIAAFRNFVVLEKEKASLMKEYFDSRTIIKYFYEWKHYVHDRNKQKTILALSYYHNNLKRTGFAAFIKVRELKIENEQVAIDFHDLIVVESALKRLQLYTYQQQIRRNSLQCQAEEFYHRKLLENVWKSWKLLPRIMKEEREKEERKEFWRQKVREILPDFNPNLEESF